MDDSGFHWSRHTNEDSAGKLSVGCNAVATAVLGSVVLYSQLCPLNTRSYRQKRLIVFWISMMSNCSLIERSFGWIKNTFHSFVRWKGLWRALSTLRFGRSTKADAEYSLWESSGGQLPAYRKCKTFNVSNCFTIEMRLPSWRLQCSSWSDSVSIEVHATLPPWTSAAGASLQSINLCLA